MPRGEDGAVFWSVAPMLVLSLAALSAPAGATDANAEDGADDRPAESLNEPLETATFGAGCFWCTEAVFQELEGVHSVVSGYSGGKLKDPTYKQVLTGLTGHAEVVQVTFNPKVISYKDLLEVFWRTHDPTTPNRQGPDVGTQYRSVIFYHTDEQKELATYYKGRVDESTMFRSPVVTEISPFDAFYPAEGYHQEYYERNERMPYCTRYIRPKVNKLKKIFKDKLKKDAKTLSKIRKSNDEWRSQLSPEQYRVARKGDTEPAFSGKYWNHKADGVYQCVCCGLPLFSSSTKFASGTGWPSFWSPAVPRHIAEEIDRSHNMLRMEVKCAQCDAHLGHVFNDGPAPTGLRYCINSASLEFKDAED